MLAYGAGGNTITLDMHGTRHCESCDQDRSFSVVLQYRYWGFDWIFNFLTMRKYIMRCDACENGLELDRKAVEAKLDGVPIPFIHRYGMLTLLELIALLLIWVA